MKDNTGYTTTLLPTAFISRVYMWMTIALAISASTAYLCATTPSIEQLFFNHPSARFVLFIAQIFLVLTLSLAFTKLNYPTALILFFAYSAISGVTLYPIVNIYTHSSLVLTFITSASMFGIMALYGYSTQTDLSSLRTILLMGLIGLIVGFSINIFFKSTMTELILSLIGVIIFSLITAYDMQMLKKLAQSALYNEELLNKFALIGALKLYLDLINLFLNLLRLSGKRKEQ